MARNPLQHRQSIARVKATWGNSVELVLFVTFVSLVFVRFQAAPYPEGPTTITENQMGTHQAHEGNKQWQVILYDTDKALRESHLQGAIPWNWCSSLPLFPWCLSASGSMTTFGEPAFGDFPAAPRNPSEVGRWPP